ncbi:MAG: Calx-beta domain-containing protein [Bacteroidales bacterium]
MKKRIFSLFVMAIAVFAFTACEKDEPEPPVVSFEQSSAEVMENSTSALQVVVRADKAINEAYEVSYTISGTAQAGVNYEELDGSVTMTAGENEAVIFINPINDTNIGEDETLILNLESSEDYDVSAEDYQVTVNILDNKTPPSDAPEVSFTTESTSTNPYLEEELEITVGISEPVDTDLPVIIDLTDATLAEGTDYEVSGLEADNQLMLPANETSASFTIHIKNTHDLGVDEVFEIGFADPVVTDYAVSESADKAEIRVTDPVVDLSTWFNADTEFNFFFASGPSIAYRTDLPAHRIKRYYWNSEEQDWSVFPGAHYFYYAENDENQWKEVINIFHKQEGWPGVTAESQARWEINGGNDFLGLTRFIENDARYMRNYVSSGDNGWIRFVATEEDASEGTIIIPEQTIPVYKVREGFNWDESLEDEDGNSYKAWYPDSRETEGKIWESSNVTVVEVAVERSEGTFNSATGDIEFDVVFTVSDPDFEMDPEYYTERDGDTYTLRLRYIPF